MRKTISGFTIVELLIVIVVVAILATISVIAYNGIQARTENAKTINGVGAYTKLFSLYAADKGEYPDTGALWPCLDTTTTVGCGRVSGGDGCGFSGLAAYAPLFYSQLADYAPKMPALSSQTMTCSGTEVYRGVYAENNALDKKNLYLTVFLRGDVPCSSPLGAATLYVRQQNDATTRCRYKMPSL